MSNNSEGLVLVREKIPYTGKGVENLVTMVRKILEDNPYTQELILRVGKPIEIARLVKSDEVPEPVTVHDTVRTRQMEEYDSTDSSAEVAIMGMFNILDKESLFPTCFLIGVQSRLYKWLDIPRRSTMVCGVELSKSDQIPDDVVILCGSPVKGGQPEDIELSVKTTIP